MPEVILPCPTNGCAGIGKIYHSPDQIYVTMLCVTCGLSTGYVINPEEAIARWNKLPRALRWTNEPPKVAGWYWHHMPPAFGTVIEFFDPEISKAGCGEWAGPIAPPIG